MKNHQRIATKRSHAALAAYLCQNTGRPAMADDELGDYA